MRLARLWPAALAAAFIGVAACGGESVNDPGPPASSGERMKPLVEQFKEARERAKSDFERSAFDHAIKNGKIDYADYEQSFSKYRQCVADAGITETYTKLSNGIYRVTSEPGADPKAYLNTTGDCADRTGLARLEALYRTQVDNPDLLADPRLVVVRCLIKAGLVPPDYTTEKLVKFLNSKDLAAPGADFDPMNAEAQKCLTAGGIAINNGGGQKSGA